jgi:hypothetical protein
MEMKTIEDVGDFAKKGEDPESGRDEYDELLAQRALRHMSHGVTGGRLTGRQYILWKVFLMAVLAAGVGMGAASIILVNEYVRKEPPLDRTAQWGAYINDFHDVRVCRETCDASGCDGRADVRVGGYGYPDGKWVCAAKRLLAAKDCLVYSVGSNDEWDFEVGVLDINPDCEVHTFDPTVEKPAHKPGPVHFHPLGVLGNNQTVMPPSYTDLVTIADKLGHRGRTIHSLKMDCEGCEFGGAWPGVERLKRELGITVERVNMEIHFWKWRRGGAEFLREMRDYPVRLGYNMTHYETNMGCPIAHEDVQGCLEVAFARSDGV